MILIFIALINLDFFLCAFELPGKIKYEKLHGTEKKKS